MNQPPSEEYPDENFCRMLFDYYEDVFFSGDHIQTKTINATATMKKNSRCLHTVF